MASTGARARRRTTPGTRRRPAPGIRRRTPPGPRRRPAIAPRPARRRPSRPAATGPALVIWTANRLSLRPNPYRHPGGEAAETGLIEVLRDAAGAEGVGNTPVLSVHGCGDPLHDDNLDAPEHFPALEAPRRVLLRVGELRRVGISHRHERGAGIRRRAAVQPGKPPSPADFDRRHRHRDRNAERKDLPAGHEDPAARLARAGDRHSREQVLPDIDDVDAAAERLELRRAELGIEGLLRGDRVEIDNAVRAETETEGRRRAGPRLLAGGGAGDARSGQQKSAHHTHGLHRRTHETYFRMPKPKRAGRG